MAKPTIQLFVKRKRERLTRRAKKRAKWGNKEEAIRKNPSQCDSRARSRRVVGDLSPWRKERREACNGSLTIGSLTISSLTIGSLTPKELHSTLFWPNPLSSKFLLKQVFSFSTSLGFSFPVFNPGWKVFSTIISILYSLLVFLPVPLIGWEVFHQLIPCLVFLLSLFIIGLGDFSLATWPVETHQLPYGARMFSMVFRFSSPVSLIGLEGFSLDFHSRFLFKIPIQDSYSRFLFKIPIQGFYLRFPFKIPIQGSHSKFLFQVLFKSSLSTDSTPSGARVWRGRQL